MLRVVRVPQCASTQPPRGPLNMKTAVLKEYTQPVLARDSWNAATNSTKNTLNE